MVDQHEIIAERLALPSPLADLPKLSEFYGNFKDMEQLKEYFDGDMYKLPMNNRMAWVK